MRNLITVICVMSICVGVTVAQPNTKKAKKGTTTATASASSGSFTPACALPFTGTTGLAIDKTCGMSGSAAANTPEGMQNMAKNNFCATGSAVTVTPDILLALQNAAQSAKVSFGSEKLLPANRSALQKGFSINGKTYHEGQKVQMAAFIIETHAADLSSGESVNCDTKKLAAGNDVHMALGTGFGVDECTSVTAELSPHFRPAMWAVLAGVKAKSTSKPAPITQYPIRVTGQLFFDASHKLCSGGKEEPGNPARQSLWEVHPVYQVDVCKNKTLAACSADADVWTPIQNWHAPSGNTPTNTAAN